jgi:hypothetical protein
MVVLFILSHFPGYCHLWDLFWGSIIGLYTAKSNDHSCQCDLEAKKGCWWAFWGILEGFE